MYIGFERRIVEPSPGHLHACIRRNQERFLCFQDSAQHGNVHCAANQDLDAESDAMCFVYKKANRFEYGARISLRRLDSTLNPASPGLPSEKFVMILPAIKPATTKETFIKILDLH
jgi:hypothetical protein